VTSSIPSIRTRATRATTESTSASRAVILPAR
jgi:hypothetical protein